MTELLRPSKKLLDAIGYDESCGLLQCEFLGITEKSNGHVSMKAEEWRRTAEASFEKLKEHYGLESAKKVFSPVWEAIQNAGIHGCSNGEMFYLYQYLCPKGVASGVHDPSPFFRSREIKEQFESRIPLREEQFDREYPLGARFGVNGFIYKFTDLIEVDDERGVLWLGHYLPGIGEE